MEIRTKFNVGDIIYYIREEYQEQTCKICEGKKTVRIKDMEFDCPHCKGKGTTNDKEVWKIEGELRVDEIRNYIGVDSIEIRNVDYKRKSAILDKDCFATKEEAQKECERRNGKGGKQLCQQVFGE